MSMTQYTTQLHPQTTTATTDIAQDRAMWIDIRHGLRVLASVFTRKAQSARSANLARLARMIDAGAAVIAKDLGLE